MTFNKKQNYCSSCPRNCKVNRNLGEFGYCKTGSRFQIGSICKHRGEEPPISGTSGICNIFFTRCNLRCSYCQNYQISFEPDNNLEKTLSLDEVLDKAESFLKSGSHAIGFVSPSHVTPQVHAIIDGLKNRGLKSAFVYNTNAYDSLKSIQSLLKKIDVFLPDLKYMSETLALRFSNAPNYPEIAKASIKEMVKEKGITLKLNSKGEATSGVIIRHLVLPGQVKNSLEVLRFLAKEISPKITLSLMSQYNPNPIVARNKELNRSITSEEYEEVLSEMDYLGFENGWIQELESKDNYKPDFASINPFET